MRQPRYFGWTCQKLLNKTPFPIQLAILHELWHRPFPMLVGSRGLGKCTHGDTLVHTSRGVCRIKELAQAPPMERVEHHGLAIAGETGERPLGYAWNNGESETVRITTRRGIELEGTLNHPIRVVSQGGVVWKNMEELRPGDRVLVDRRPQWHSQPEPLDDELAYLFGLLVGGGGYTVRGRIGLTTADEEICESASRIARRFWGQPFRKVRAKYQHYVYSVAVWDELFTKYGFNSPVCGDKDVPACVLRGPKSACAAFLRGLFDTDGSVESGYVSLSAKSANIIKTVQFLLTRFGIVSTRRPKLNKKYGRVYWQLRISGHDATLFAERIGFGLKRKQDALSLLSAKKHNPNLDTIPRELVVDDTLKLLTLSRRRKGQGRNPMRVSPYKLKAYEPTYALLRRVLEHTGEHSSSDAWKRLASIEEANWYYDTVTDVTPGRATTYDVNVPDGHSFISNGLVSHNSFILALYCVLRMLLCQGTQIVVVGSAFRQAKIIFDYAEGIWTGAGVLRDICASSDKNGPRRDIDRCTLRIGESLMLAIPLGTGEKIRGLRANILLCDEFASINNEVFENVVSGFAVVSQDPMEKVRQAARKKAMERHGLVLPNTDTSLAVPGLRSNQTVISGTAYYGFNHFHAYWKRWKAIVESQGDRARLEEIFNGAIPENFEWRDYSVMRVPYQFLPDGFLDDKHVTKARATIHVTQFRMEYAAIFCADSNGFFRRSLIESCVVGRPGKPIRMPSCGDVDFQPTLRGEPGRRYVAAIDPASERDNFSIVVLELWPEHRRVVYCWTTTRSRFKAKLAKGLVQEDDFYAYAARKVRDLQRLFPCDSIAIDTQGGGVAIMEALGSVTNLKEGELPFWPVVNRDEPRDTDNKPGLHLLVPVNFHRADWVAEANHGLRKDMEDKSLLFPSKDEALVGLAIAEDSLLGRTNEEGERLYEGLEDLVFEIEELKDELATIVHTQTGATMRDHWDVPEVKLPGGKKGRLRKDRYSALLMANDVARRAQRAVPVQGYEYTCGFAHQLVGLEHAPRARMNHQNPQWYTACAHPGTLGHRVSRR